MSLIACVHHFSANRFSEWCKHCFSATSSSVICLFPIEIDSIIFRRFASQVLAFWSRYFHQMWHFVRNFTHPCKKLTTGTLGWKSNKLINIGGNYLFKMEGRVGARKTAMLCHAWNSPFWKLAFVNEQWAVPASGGSTTLQRWLGLHLLQTSSCTKTGWEMHLAYLAGSQATTTTTFSF